MKRPMVLCAGVVLGALGLSSTGCQQAGHAGAVSKAKPDDPTAWSDKDVLKGDPASGNSAGLPRSSGRPGTWSSEAQDVERSLGVGR